MLLHHKRYAHLLYKCNIQKHRGDDKSKLGIRVMNITIESYYTILMA